ncbi:MAG: flagellar hook-basal body complex protein FliE [Pirellulales bacterium]
MTPISPTQLPLSAVQPQSAAATQSATATGQTKGGSSFKQMMLQSLQDVNSMQQQANQAVETLMTGGDVEPAAVLTAVQKADLSFRLMLQMRNKMMQVFQEVKDIRI